MLGATQLIGFGGGVAAAGGPAVTTFHHKAIDATPSTNVATFTGVVVPSASATIVIATGQDGISGGTVATITVGGNSMTKAHVDADATANKVSAEVWYRDAYSNGSTVTVVVTWSSGTTGRAGIGVWSMTGNAQGGAADGGGHAQAGGADLDLDLNVTEGGNAIAYAFGDTNAPPSWTWVGVTEESGFDETVEAGFTHTGSSDDKSSASTPLTLTATGDSPYNKAGASAAWVSA